jgi:hypothetical protein
MAHDVHDPHWAELLRPLDDGQRAWVLSHPIWVAGGNSGAHCLIEIAAWRCGAGQRPSAAVFDLVAAGERVWGSRPRAGV